MLIFFKLNRIQFFKNDLHYELAKFYYAYGNSLLAKVCDFIIFMIE